MSTDSSQNSPTQNSSNDEIDLRALFQAIGDFFRNLFMGFIRAIIYLRNTVWRNKLLIGGLAILGGAGGFIANSLITPYFYSSMVVNSQHFKGNLITNTFTNLDNLCNDANYPILADKLNLSLEEAMLIRGFSLWPIITQDEILKTEALIAQLDPQDDLEAIQRLQAKIDFEQQSTYKIGVEVYDVSIYEKLDSAIVNYLLSNQYIRKRIDIGYANLEAKQKKLNIELSRLDSLKQLIYANVAAVASQTRQGSNNVILAEGNSATDPLSVIREDMRLYEEELNVQRNLYLRSDIEIIEPFTRFNKPVNPGTIKSAIYGILLGLGLGIGIGLLLDFNRYLNSVEQKHAA